MPAVALAALPAIVIALMGMLLLYALTMLIRVLANAIPSWGIPGLGNLRNAFVNAIDKVISLEKYTLSLAVVPLVSAIYWPITFVKSMLTSTYNTARSLYTLSSWVVHSYVPTIYAEALKYTSTEVALAEAAATSALNTVHSVLDQDIVALRSVVAASFAQAEQDAANLVNAVHTVLDADIVALRNTAAADLNLAEGFASAAASAALAAARQSVDALATTVTAQVGILTTDIGQALRTAEGYADTAAGAAITSVIGPLVTDVDNIIDQSWTEITDDVNATIGILSTDLPDILSDLQSIPRDLPIGLAGVAAISIPFARTVATYLRECGVPNCINLSQLGRDLQALLGLVEDASFLAFIVALIHDPSEAEAIIDDVFRPIMNDTISLAREALSV